MELSLLPMGVSTVILFFLDDFFELLDPLTHHARRNDQHLRKTARAAITLLITLGISIGYVSCGVINLHPMKYISLLVIIQLFISSSIISFLSQILDLYGICGIFSLSVILQTSRIMFWKAFSPVVIYYQDGGSVFEGAILYFLYSLTLYNNKIGAIEDALFRLNQPNLTMLGTSILIFSLIIYLKDMRMEIPVKSKKEPLLRGTYPIKLFYSEPRVLMLQVSLQIFHI
jgi:preprotein translocase subunit SecY